MKNFSVDLYIFEHNFTVLDIHLGFYILAVQPTIDFNLST